MTQLSQELREAVESLTEEETVLFGHLSEETVAAVEYGVYTDGVLEDIFSAIFRTYDLDESDWLDIEAAINEFVDDYWMDEESLEEAKRKGKAAPAKGEKKPGLISRALSFIGREAAKQAEKRLSGVKAQKGTAKHKLVHAARGALKQYASGKKGTAAQIAKRSASKFVTKGAKAAVRKGMKMVFGTWRKADGKGAAKPAGEAPKEAPKPEAKPPEKKRRKKKTNGEAVATEERMYEQAGMPKAPQHMKVVKVDDGFDVWMYFEYLDQFIRKEDKRENEFYQFVMTDSGWWEKTDEDGENALVGHIRREGDGWSAELAVRKPFMRGKWGNNKTPEDAIKRIDYHVSKKVEDWSDDYYADIDRRKAERERRGY